MNLSSPKTKKMIKNLKEREKTLTSRFFYFTIQEIFFAIFTGLMYTVSTLLVARKWKIINLAGREVGLYMWRDCGKCEAFSAYVWCGDWFAAR